MSKKTLGMLLMVGGILLGIGLLIASPFTGFIDLICCPIPLLMFFFGLLPFLLGKDKD
ncbi:hypothetical protein KAW38_02375 [Candidatus Micrarchaeota archaeon]|nr:hypothetical protein [Candidatus Micrarchaeota archaeon]